MSDSRPAVLPVDPMQVPQELKDLSRWVVWRNERIGGKWTKPPYSASTERLASSTGQETWSAFDRALRAYSAPVRKWDGIGIVLWGEDHLTGVDLDHCINRETGEVAEWALAIVKRLNSYTERSPSGDGLRIFLIAKLPPGGRKQGDIEVYETGRYLTVTGQHFDGTPRTVEERTEELTAWHGEAFKKREKPATNTERCEPSALNLTDSQLLEAARAARNGADVDALFRGNWEGRYKSRSEADLALCSHLAFYAQGDPSTVDRLFRSSGLMREKWDEAHYEGGKRYGEGTIETAVEGMREFWTPPGSVRVFEAANRNGHAEEPAAHASVSAPIYLATDTGNAERLQYQHGRDLRYCHPWKKWLVWDGIRWVPDATAEAERRAISTAKSVWKEVAVEEDETKKKQLVKHALVSEGKDRIKGMLTVMGMLSGVPVLPPELDRDPWLLCCENGTLDLRTGVLLKSQRKNLITKLVPVEFDPDAECPLWEAFLDRIFAGNEAVIGFIRRAVGYSLTGTVRERCFFVCHGEGANGKSSFFDVISSMLGDYAHRTPTETLLMKREESATNDLAALMGRRFVFASESEEDRRLAVSRIKDITGRDKITARFLHQEFFTFEPEFKLWLATNHRPRITDTNRAIWDRVRLIPFLVTIPKCEQDSDLPEKLRAEFAGILAWAVRGCVEWQRLGLAEPDEVVRATESYRQAEDVTDQFLAEMTVQVDGMSIQADRLYQAYVGWATKGGEHPLSRRKFGERLREKGMEPYIGTDRYTFWPNLQLVQQYQDEDSN